jgi:hypothetical protein
MALNRQYNRGIVAMAARMFREQGWSLQSWNQGEVGLNACDLGLNPGCLGLFLMRDSHALSTRIVKIHFYVNQ